MNQPRPTADDEGVVRAAAMARDHLDGDGTLGEREVRRCLGGHLSLGPAIECKSTSDVRAAAETLGARGTR